MNTHTKLILASALLLGGGTALAADPRPTGPASGAKPPQAAATNPRPQQGGADPEALSPARKSGPDSLSPAHTGTGGAQQPQAQGVPGAPGGPRNPGAGAMINKDVIPMPRPDIMPNTDGGSQQPGRPLPGAGPRPQP